MAAPFDLQLHALQVGDLLRLLLHLQLHQLGPEHLHAVVLVLELAALGLAGDHHAGGDMDQADSRGGLVHVLAAGAAGPVDLHFNVLGADLNVRVLGQVGHDLHRGKGGLAAGVGVKGGDPDQPVHPVLAPEVAVGVFPLNHNGGGFEAGFVPLLVVHNFIGKAVALCPAGVHPVEHLGPVLGFGAAGPGVEGQDGVGGVVLAGEQGLEPGRLHAGNEGCVLLLQLRQEGLVLFLVAHLAHDHHVIPGGAALGLGLQLVFQLLELLQDLLGVFRVVPEAVSGTLGLQKVHLPGGAFQVQGFFQVVQLGEKVIELYLIFIKLKHLSITHIL